MRFPFFLTLGVLVSFTASADEAVTIRATSALPDAVIKYIANVSEPRAVQLKSGETPDQLIADVCGTYTDAYAEVFFDSKVNPGLVRGPTAGPRWVKVPACAKWRNRKVGIPPGSGLPTKVLPGEDRLDLVLERKIGRPGNRILKCFEAVQSSRCGQAFRELVQQLNPQKNLAALQPGDTVNLPFATYPVTFKVRPPATALEVTKKIAELGHQTDPDSPIIRNVAAPKVRMVTAVTLDDVDAEQSCSEARAYAAKDQRQWPYDVAQVVSVLKKNEAAHRKNNQLPTPPTLTIIDTGLDATFPERFLQEDRSVDPKLRFGIGAVRAEQFRPWPGHRPDSVRLHGTHVAEIAAGGSGLRKSFKNLNRLYRLNVVNVVEPPDAAGEHGITIGGLTQAMDWSTSNGQIANLSVGSESELSGVRDAVARNSNLLVVVAAGNESSSLIDFALYPANYGGTYHPTGTQVITVAAHDGVLRRASFSNIGNRYADLFAPGCDVPFDGKHGVHGTSFAAPLVSMTAALLRAFGLKTPKDVKHRLQASVDFDDAYSELVLWSGRLNVVKAVSLYDDVLQRLSSKATLSFGRWELPPEGVCEDKNIDGGAIRKINAIGQGDSLLLRLIRLDSQKIPIEETCKPLGTGLKLNGLAEEIPWHDLLDFVPRHYR